MRLLEMIDNPILWFVIGLLLSNIFRKFWRNRE